MDEDRDPTPAEIQQMAANSATRLGSLLEHNAPEMIIQNELMLLLPRLANIYGKKQIDHWYDLAFSPSQQLLWSANRLPKGSG